MTTSNAPGTIEDRILAATIRIRREVADEIGTTPDKVGVFIHPARPTTASVYVSSSYKRFIPSGVTL